MAGFWRDRACVLWIVCIVQTVVVLASQVASQSASQLASRPNMVVIIADDLGIGDIGCFGNDTIKTPNIDGLCEAGVRLTQHVAGDAVCTPSRAAFFTSRLPVRTGMAATSRMPIIPTQAFRGGLPANETTFPKLLQGAGYRTALIGKWHLGLNCERYGDHCHHPNSHGFDYFFGLPLTNFRNMYNDSNVIAEVQPERIQACYVTGGVLILSSLLFYAKGKSSLAVLTFLLFLLFTSSAYLIIGYLHIWNSILMRNGDVVEMPVNMENLAQRLVNEGIRYLEQQTSDQPFLLVMSWVQVHTALHASWKFQGHSAHGAYGDEVEEMDWSSGEIITALRKLKLMDNTIIYFSSDNGGHKEEHHGYLGYRTGGHNGIYRGSKGQGGQEGGIRVPSAIVWKNRFPAGAEVSVPTSQMDVFPTLLAAAGIEPPRVRVLDGVDILPLLKEPGNGMVPHRFMFHYCGMWLHAVRYTPGDGQDVFKVYYYLPNDHYDTSDVCPPFMCRCINAVKLATPQITNVGRDPRETSNLDPESDTYKSVLAAVERAVEEHMKTRSEVPLQLNMGFSVRLQPCCSTYFCMCSRDDQNALEYVAPWDR